MLVLPSAWQHEFSPLTSLFSSSNVQELQKIQHTHKVKGKKAINQLLYKRRGKLIKSKNESN